jgi:hypothetical protein
MAGQHMHIFKSLLNNFILLPFGWDFQVITLPYKMQSHEVNHGKTDVCHSNVNNICNKQILIVIKLATGDCSIPNFQFPVISNTKSMVIKLLRLR